MRMGTDEPKSSADAYLRIVGVSIAVTTAGAQALTVGQYWWNHPGNPYSYQGGMLALTGWCVAGGALLLARYRMPGISTVLPGGVIAGSIWMSVEFLREQGVAYGPLGPITLGNIIALATALAANGMFFIGPVVGAWLVGYAGRRRRRQLQLHRISAEAFD